MDDMQGHSDGDDAALKAALVEELKTLAIAAHHVAAAIERSERPLARPALVEDVRVMIRQLRRVGGRVIDDVGRRRLGW
jgi:hypothetical protein